MGRGGTCTTCAVHVGYLAICAREAYIVVDDGVGCRTIRVAGNLLTLGINSGAERSDYEGDETQ